MPSNPGALEGSKDVSASKVSDSKITKSSMNMSGEKKVDKGGKVNEVDEKTQWKYSLKWLTLSLLDETEMEFKNIVEGGKLCFERDFMYL